MNTIEGKRICKQIGAACADEVGIRVYRLVPSGRTTNAGRLLTVFNGVDVTATTLTKENCTKMLREYFSGKAIIKMTDNVTSPLNNNGSLTETECASITLVAADSEGLTVTPNVKFVGDERTYVLTSQPLEIALNDIYPCKANNGVV